MRRLVLAAAVLAAGASARAGDVNPRAEPSVWLGQIYDLYRRAENNLDLLNKQGSDLIEARASRNFAALLKRDADCVAKSNQVCAIDWDYIVNGQDWELSQVKVGPLKAAGDKATVTVAFRNMKSANSNIYYFVREGGDWKVDDIETHQSGRMTIRIAEWLRGYKDY